MKSVLFLSLLIVTACGPVSPTASIELCEKTVLEYGPLRDDGPSEQYAELFTADGEFHLGPTVTKGRDALVARHIKANSDTIWRHNMTNIQISDESGRLSGITRFHIYTGPKASKPGAPAREILGDYIDDFVIENGTCKIKLRRVKIVFDTSN